jgi:nucleoside phosphorylase
MSDPWKYTVGWTCTIETEYIAACLFLDEQHARPNYVSVNDKNDYTLGKMAGHNVVIAVSPSGEYGLSSASTVARDMLDSFPNVRVCLLVGIGGGAPTAKHDIRLGDIVISRDVRQYDYIETLRQQNFQQRKTRRQLPTVVHSFKRTGFSNHPPKVIRAAVSSLESKSDVDGYHIDKRIVAVLDREPELRQTYSRPRQRSDLLHAPEIVHPRNSEFACEEVCGSQTASLVLRPERKEGEDGPAIHYGVVASFKQLLNDATMRDTIAKKEDVICIETETAGLMHNFPCLTVRGVCDYSDSHKNKDWQGYAAITAAAYTKGLLLTMVPSMVEQQEKIRESYEKWNRIREWLKPPDSSIRHNWALKEHLDGTGLWFTHSDAFEEWKRQPGSFIWLHGVSGCGMTVLTSAIIEHLRQISPDQVLLYFYFDFRDVHKQSLDSMLRFLIQQLCDQQPETLQLLHHLWASYGEGIRRPSTKSLQNALQSMLSRTGNVSIVLEALDKSDTRYELLAWLRSLVESKTNDFRVLVTACSGGDIAWALRRWTRVEDRVSMQRNEVIKDIGAYIKNRVRNGDEFRRWRERPEILEVIELNLVQNSDQT